MRLQKPGQAIGLYQVMASTLLCQTWFKLAGLDVFPLRFTKDQPEGYIYTLTEIVPCGFFSPIFKLVRPGLALLSAGLLL